jgi:ABC-type uncharacterized transport system auxiliary subunit
MRLVYLVSVFLVFVLGGCVTKQPHIDEYRVSTTLNITPSHKDGCKQKSIKVSPTFSKNSLRELEMAYIYDDYKLDYFTQSQWSETPNSAINSEIVSMLRELQLFESVQVSQSRSRSDYILESSIEDFIQYFDQKSQKSFVDVRITLSIVDTKTAKTIATRSFQKKLSVKEMNAQSGVQSLNLALAKLLNESSLWLEEVCQ